MNGEAFGEVERLGIDAGGGAAERIDLRLLKPAARIGGLDAMLLGDGSHE